jgi:chromosome segregation ATPase
LVPGITFHLAVAAYMFGMVSLFPALRLRTLSLLVIMPGNCLTTRWLKARSASQFVKLGRGAAITQLKLDLFGLRDQLRATRDGLAVKAADACQAERALAAKESELARLTYTLDERSMQEDVQRTEIVALRMQVETLQAQLAQAGEATKAAEQCRDGAVRALSEKESELARLAPAFDQQKTDIVALRAQVEGLQAQHAVADAKAAEERRELAIRILSDKESELARLTTALDERSVLAESQKVENVALTMQVQMLNERLTAAGEEARAVQEHRDVALRAMSEKESELVRLRSILEERSVLIDSQKVENAALRTQVRALNERLIQASEEISVVEESRDVERGELKAAIQNLVDERTRLENFHRQVVELVQQLTVQRTEEKVQEQRAREDLEDRLAEQSRLLNESESELTHLRGEIKSARKAEDDLRIAFIEIDGRANATIHNLITEKAQLKATLDRANGERVRVAHELADLKRWQAHESSAAETQSDDLNDIAGERARRAANGGPPRGANS